MYQKVPLNVTFWGGGKVSHIISEACKNNHYHQLWWENEFNIRNSLPNLHEWMSDLKSFS